MARGKSKKTRKRDRSAGSASARPQRARKLTEAQQIQVDAFLREADRARQAADLKAAAHAFQQVLRIDPDHAPALFGLSQCLSRLGMLERAIELGRRAVRRDSRNALYRAGLADALAMHGEHEQAKRLAEEALRIDRRHPIAHQTLAQVHRQHGEYDAAIAHLEEARTHYPDDPNMAVEHAHLLRLAKRGEEAVRIIESVANRDDVPGPIVVGALHEAAMIHDMLGRYDQAYEYLTRYADKMFKLPGTADYPLQTWLDFVHANRRTFTPERLQRFDANSVSAETPAPAFLIGFPRSGTTMLEQVLDAHPQVTTAEEPPYFTDVKRRFRELVNSPGDLEKAFDELDESKIIELRRLYWSVVEKDRGAGFMHGASVFLHKLPLLIHDLGLINAIFPDSRVIVALRDPRDCCFSCVLQDFDLNASMVHFLRLSDTCRMYRETFELYLGMRDHLQLSTLEVRYEDTVRDLEAQARKVLNFLGVAWDDSVLRFHEKARQKHIRTPSGAAVREQVYTRSVARWKHYAKYFEPYLDELRPFVREFGYEDADASA